MNGSFVIGEILDRIAKNVADKVSDEARKGTAQTMNHEVIVHNEAKVYN